MLYLHLLFNFPETHHFQKGLTGIQRTSNKAISYSWFCYQNEFSLGAYPTTKAILENYEKVHK